MTTRSSLLRIAGALGLTGMDERHTYAIINNIRGTPGLRADVLLPLLSDGELRLLAGDLGVSGASRQERIDRLMAFSEGAGASPQPPLPAPRGEGERPVQAVPSVASREPGDRAAVSASGALASASSVAPVAASVPAPAAASVAASASVPAAASVAAAAAGAPGHAGRPVVAPGAVLRPHHPPDSFSLVPPSSRSSRGKRGASRLPGSSDEAFVAIDFETADSGRDSACAVALVRVERDQIVQRVASLIRPPRRDMRNAWVHGISWEMVADKPSFAELWPGLRAVFEGASYLVAHNAPFDRSVLQACCVAAGLPEPALPFECTVQMARSVWGLPSARLPALCERFGIPLRHHDAGSDAEACARLVLVARAMRKGS